MAAAKRRLCYIKGLKAAGDSIDVVICNRVFECGEDDGFKASDTYEGTPFCYAAGKFKHAEWNKLMRGLDWMIIDPFRSFIYGIKHIHKGEIVFIYFYPVFLQLLILLATKIKGAKAVKETCEHPNTQRNMTKLQSKIQSWIDFHFIMPLYDGFVAISQDLETFVNQYRNQKAKVIRIPILVDPEPYEKDFTNEKSLFDVPYIVHTGTMNEQKDSISKILRAFARFRKENNDPLKLVFTGKQSSPKKCKYLHSIKELGIENDVILMGYLTDSDIINLQHFAAMTIIYKSDNLQTRNCFPTKLGEMLMSGVPVITTTVGDAKIYLEEGGALFIKENDDDSLLACIHHLLEDAEDKNKIVNKGKSVAYTKFNPIIQGETLSTFFKNL